MTVGEMGVGKVRVGEMSSILSGCLSSLRLEKLFLSGRKMVIVRQPPRVIEAFVVDYGAGKAYHA